MDIVSGILFGLLILVGLSLVVTLHEAGHFAAARWAGVEVEAFAVGWGPILWKWKPKDVEYRLCLLPLGGYCKMKGERDLVAAMESHSTSIEASPGSLFGATPWKRIVISAAGPLANLATALVVFTVLALVGVPSTGLEARILLASAVDGRTGTPAEAAGLATGDLVTAVDGRPVAHFADLQARIAESQGRAQAWSLVRDGASLTATVTPQWDQKEGRALVGIYALNPPIVSTVAPGTPAELAGLAPGDRITAVDGQAVVGDQQVWKLLGSPSPLSHRLEVASAGATTEKLLVVEDLKKPLGLAFATPRYPAVGLPPLEAAASGWKNTWGLLGQMTDGLAGLFVGKSDPVQALSGPIGIVGEGSRITESAFAEGWDFGLSAFVKLMAFLSLALFLMNLLPIPALDGGSIVLSLVEGVRRKPLGLKALVAYQQTGAFVVLALLLFTTLNDMGLFGKG